MKIDNLTNLFQELYESEERKKWLTDMLKFLETELGNEVEEYRFGARSCLYRINREVLPDDEHADKVKLLYKLHDEYAEKLPLTEVEYDEIINYIRQPASGTKFFNPTSDI